MSAPSSPGGVRRVRARRSVATAARPPLAWTARMAGRRSRMLPSVAGYWKTAPKTSWASIWSSGSPTTRWMPRCAARVRMTAMVCGWQRRSTKKAGGFAAADPAGHGHGLGGGGGLIEERGVGELQAGEVDHHLLVVEEGLQPALADLGLVGRVGGVPGRVLEQVAQDDGRGDGAVVAGADQRGGLAVLGWRARAGGPGPGPRSAARAGGAGARCGCWPARRGRPARRARRARGRPAWRRSRPAAARYGGSRTHPSARARPSGTCFSPIILSVKARLSSRSRGSSRRRRGPSGPRPRWHPRGGA